jgi:putative flavoprotein involved in K+ transport
VSVGTRPLALPQRFLGKDLFWWMTRAGLFGLSAESTLGRRLRDRGDLVIGSSHRQLRRAGVTFRPRLVAVEGRTAAFADRSSYDLDAVVWATGFRPDYSWMEVTGAVVDGRPAHQRGVTTVPGLFFLGLPWQHTRGSALLGFVKHDAAWLSGVMAEHRLPARELMS